MSAFSAGTIAESANFSAPGAEIARAQMLFFIDADVVLASGTLADATRP
jgi:hypothetical protein